MRDLTAALDRVLEREFDRRLDHHLKAGLDIEAALYETMTDLFVLAGQTLAKLRHRRGRRT